MQIEKIREFTNKEHQTWKSLYENLAVHRKVQACPMFAKGLEKLKMNGDGIPNLGQINERLKGLTGWQGVPVAGLEDGPSFFAALSRREFPIGNFIRNPEVSSYTPAPDIFHDLYGHIPLFADRTYADFNCEFGTVALRYGERPEQLRAFERLYWFTLEFALINLPVGRRIFGAGIISSFGESNYALGFDRGAQPEVIPFNLKLIRDQEFRIDEFQKKLFVLSSEQELYQCLPEFVRLVDQIIL